MGTYDSHGGPNMAFTPDLRVPALDGSTVSALP